MIEKQVTFESKNLTLNEQEVALKRNSIAKKLFNRFKSTFELKREKIKTVFGSEGAYKKGTERK